MRRITQYVLMLGLIPVVMVTVACSSPAPKVTSQAGPTRSPTATPLAAAPQEFVSKRYGFRLTLTKQWSETDAQVGWTGKQLEGLASPAFANFTDTGTDRTFVAASAGVPKGMRLATWRAAMVRAAPSVCADSPSATATTLGGEPALAWTATCGDGYDVHKLAALHGDRGYMTILASATANDNAVDQRVFESIRGSFTFTG